MQGADIAVHDMGVDLGGLDVGMAEEILEDADIYPVFQKMGGETVTANGPRHYDDYRAASIFCSGVAKRSVHDLSPLTAECVDAESFLHRAQQRLRSQ